MDDELRITDLSGIEPENFKFRNTQFLNDGNHPYAPKATDSDPKIRRQNWNTRNGDLRRVLEDFPTDEPLIDQCALWMHAVVGKHFFRDANHRTAVALLRELLRDNGIDPGTWSIERLEEVRDESHEVRREIEEVRLDTLYQRDELYEVWLSFFKDEFDPKPLEKS